VAARVRSIRRNGAPGLRIIGPPHTTRIQIADFLSRVLIVQRSERIVRRRNALTHRRLNRGATRLRRPRRVLTPLRAADILRRVIVPAVGARITAVGVAVRRAAVVDRVAAEAVVGHAAAEAAATMEAVVRLALVNFPI
jgi:hypothetical protein